MVYKVLSLGVFLFLFSSKAIGQHKDVILGHSLYYSLKTSDALLLGEILSYSKPLDSENGHQRAELLVKASKTAGYDNSDRVNGNLFRVSLLVSAKDRANLGKIKLHKPSLLVLKKNAKGYYLDHIEEQLFYFERKGREYLLSHRTSGKFFSQEQIDELSNRYLGEPMLELSIDNLSYRAANQKVSSSSRAPASIMGEEKSSEDFESQDFYWVIVILTMLGIFSIKLCYRQD